MLGIAVNIVEIIAYTVLIVWLIRNGLKMPSIPLLVRIAEFFGCTVENDSKALAIRKLYKQASICFTKGGEEKMAVVFEKRYGNALVRIHDDLIEKDPIKKQQILDGAWKIVEEVALRMEREKMLAERKEIS